MKLSKSNLALAKVINGNGGWPQDSEWVVQNGEHGRISFSINKPVRHDSKSWMAKGGFNFKIEVCKPLKNWHQNVLSREEYYQAYPKVDADGWIEWSGGECPVYGDDDVDVVLVDGSTDHGIADDFDWNRDSGPLSVASYRLHKPEVKPDFCESVMRSIPDPESKPTIEQLAHDYRNKIDYANSKQQEADDAKAEADAALGELERAGEALGLLIAIAKQEPEPELVITDWRDLKVGDVIWVGGTKAVGDEPEGECTIIDEYIEEYAAGLRMFLQPFNVRRGDAEFRPDLMCRGWKFIRRP